MHQKIRAGIFLLYALIFGISGSLGADLRYLSYAYAVLAIIIIILVRSGVVILDRFFTDWLIFYTLMIAITTIASYKVLTTCYFYNQLFLILLPPLFAGIIFSHLHVNELNCFQHLESLFVRSIFIIAFVRIIPSLHKFDLASINIIYSSSPLESGLSHLMGLVFVFCLIRRRKLDMFISFTLTVLFTKRIAIAATLLIIVVYMINKLFKQSWRWKLTIWIIVSGNILYLLLIYDIMYKTLLDDMFRSLTGLSINQFTLGRFKLYQDLKELITLKSLIAGNGTGQVNIFLRKFSIYEHIGFNPHSDFLRLILEYGLIFSIFWFGKIYLSQIIYRDYKLLLIPLFLNILMFTDNVIIYHYIMIPFFIMIFFNFKRQQIIEHD